MAELSESELSNIARVIAQGPYEGYPDNSHRLFIHDVLVKDDRINIPDGPWHVTNHPNREVFRRFPVAHPSQIEESYS